jgi:hypothetical protein
MNSKKHIAFSIKRMFLVIAMICLLLTGYVQFRRCGLLPSEVSKVREGMNADQIISRIGSPHRIDGEGDWIYDVWGFKTLTVGFDKDGLCLPPAL